MTKHLSAAIQGKYCKGICENFHCKLTVKGEKKYVNNVRCTYCEKYMPKSMVVMVGMYQRCPCCTLKVRTKRFHSVSHNKKEAAEMRINK